MSLDAIPIRIVDLPSGGGDRSAGLTGNARPLLHELSASVQRLLDTGDTTTIDLSALPLTPADLDWLRDKLGEGEIAMTLQAGGESTLSETACPGIWWVTHRNAQGVETSQFIEVAFVPELARAHPEDVAIGRESLEHLISDLE